MAILSDLFDDVARIIAGLKHFRHRRHEVIVFHILDPAELDFPFRETTLFKGLEGMPEVLTEPHALRRAYQAEIGAFLDELKKGCRMIDIDYVPLRTDQSLDVAAVELPGVAVGPAAASVTRLVADVDTRLQDGTQLTPLPLPSGLGPRASPTCPCSTAWPPRRCRSSSTCSTAASSGRCPGRRCGSCWRRSGRTAADPDRAVAAAGDPDAADPPGRRGDGQAVPGKLRQRDRRAGGRTGCSCSTAR